MVRHTVGRTRFPGIIFPIFELGLGMARTERLPKSTEWTEVNGGFLGKDQPITLRGHQPKIVAINTKAKLGRNLPRDLRAEIEVSVRAASSVDKRLEPLVDEFPQQAKELHKIALTCAVGPDEHI